VTKSSQAHNDAPAMIPYSKKQLIAYKNVL